MGDNNNEVFQLMVRECMGKLSSSFATAAGLIMSVSQVTSRTTILSFFHYMVKRDHDWYRYAA